MPTYTDLTQVMRILQSSSGEKIRFSSTSLVGVRTGKVDNETVRNIKPNLNMSFNYQLVTISDTLAGQVTLFVYFETAEDFKVFMVDPVIKSDLYLSSGSTLIDYTTPDGLVTIPALCWGGNIVAKDVVELRFDAHISNENALLYIEDAEIMVDTIMESNGIRFLLGDATRVYEPDEIPEQIRVATSYLACYLIFTDGFADVKNDKDLQFSYPARWKKRAEDLLKSYIRAKGLVPPRIFGFPSFVDRIGDSEVGPGASGRTTVRTELNRPSGSEGIFDP